MGVLEASKSPENISAPLSRRESFESVEGPVSGEYVADRAAWKRSETADHAMRLLTLEFFKHLHGLLRKTHRMPGRTTRS